jgi:hypothetical protein
VRGVVRRSTVAVGYSQCARHRTNSDQRFADQRFSM